MAVPTSEPRPRSRRAVSTVLTAVLVVLLLAAVGASVHVGLAPASLPSVGATRYVAVDGQRGFADFSEAGQSSPAMVENALLTGSQIVSTVPGATWRAMAPSPESDRNRAHWWREGVVVSGVQTPTSRYRIRSITDQGVRLHGQTWGRLGITFEPALLELPPEPVVGSRWTTSGQALADPDDQLLNYANTSSARRPSDPTDAEAGCLQISSETTLQPDGRPVLEGAAGRWTETQLWCPGQGVVADEGDFRGTRFALGRTAATTPSTLSPAALAPADPPRGQPSGWRQGTFRADDGDPTFGANETLIDADGSRAVADSSGTLHVVNTTERDVNTLTPLTNGRFWAHGWMHPGAQITTVSSVGGLVVLTTADRRLMGYDFDGRLRWSATLPEVAVVAPAVYAGDRLLVATLGGQVLSYDARTGVRIWRHDLETAVVAELTTGGGTGLVVGSDHQLHALSLSDGHEFWNSGVPTEKTEVAVIGDQVLTHTYSHLTALNLRTGRATWELTGLGDTDALRVFGSTAVILLADQVRGYDAATGRLRWTRPGAVADARRFGGHDFLLGSTSMVTVDESGRDLHRWPIDVDLGRHPHLLTGAGQLWAVGADPEGFTGVWIGDREPGA